MIAVLLLSVACVLPMAAWCGHTDESRRAAQLIEFAFRSLGWTFADMADRMGLTVPQLSRQLSGADPLNYWRLGNLPAEFHRRHDAFKAEARGALLIEADVVAAVRAHDASPAVPCYTRIVTLPLEQQKAMSV